MKFELHTAIGFWRQKVWGVLGNHLFYGLRKPLQEAIHAKFTNPLNDYMALMSTARKAEDEHEQEKHNTSCASKLGVVSKGPSNQEGITNPDSEAPTKQPWSKWVEMHKQLMAAIKGAQNALMKSTQQGSNQGQRRNSQSTSTSSQRSQWQSNSQNNGTSQNNQTQARGRSD